MRKGRFIRARGDVKWQSTRSKLCNSHRKCISDLKRIRNGKWMLNSGWLRFVFVGRKLGFSLSKWCAMHNNETCPDRYSSTKRWILRCLPHSRHVYANWKLIGSYFLLLLLAAVAFVGTFYWFVYSDVPFMLHRNRISKTIYQYLIYFSLIIW